MEAGLVRMAGVSRVLGRVKALPSLTIVRRHYPTTQSSDDAGWSTSGDATLRRIIGGREVVGYGSNGRPMYHDSVVFPFPAIRFKEDDPHLKALREKEKGDWKKLTLQEKKALYRASFRQTLAEVDAPTGEFKSCLGFALMFASFAVLGHLVMSHFIYGPLPPSFDEDAREAQLRRYLDLRMNPLSSPTADWDYEKDTWKS